MAQLSTGDIDNLPDADFAYIEPGGKKDDSDKTVPRSLRHFPIHDAAHVRNALARIGQGAEFGQQALPKVRAAAKRLGVDAGGKVAGGAEVKSFALKLDAVPDDEGRFSGHASVFGNVDKGKDLIEPGAFTKSLQENPTVPILWAHNTDEPIGVSTSMVEDGKGLRVEGQLAMDVQRAREVHSLMKMGAIKGLSIGYDTVKRDFKDGVRHLKELALGEFSPVVFPMNTAAGITGVKAATVDMQSHLDAITDIAASADPGDAEPYREPIRDAIKSLEALHDSFEPAENDVNQAESDESVEAFKALRNALSL